MKSSRKQPIQAVSQYDAAQDTVRTEMITFRQHHPFRRFIEIPVELTTDEVRRLLETAAMEKRLQ